MFYHLPIFICLDFLFDLIYQQYPYSYTWSYENK